MIEETERLLTDKDGDSLYARRAGNPNGMRVLYVDSADGEVYVPADAVEALEREIQSPGYVAGLKAAALELRKLQEPGTVTIAVTREDAQELALILTGDRYHMDKGDGHAVPQPRWGANVRVSGAVDRALGRLPQESWDR